MGYQPIDGDSRVGERVPDCCRNDGAGSYPDQRPGDLRRLPLLPKRGDLDRRSRRGLGVPHTHGDIQAKLEGVVREPASGSSVGVGLDLLQICRGDEPFACSWSGAGQERAQANGQFHRSCHDESLSGVSEFVA